MFYYGKLYQYYHRTYAYTHLMCTHHTSEQYNNSVFHVNDALVRVVVILSVL